MGVALHHPFSLDCPFLTVYFGIPPILGNLHWSSLPWNDIPTFCFPKVGIITGNPRETGDETSKLSGKISQWVSPPCNLFTLRSNQSTKNQQKCATETLMVKLFIYLFPVRKKKPWDVATEGLNKTFFKSFVDQIHSYPPKKKMWPVESKISSSQLCWDHNSAWNSLPALARGARVGPSVV